MTERIVEAEWLDAAQDGGWRTLEENRARPYDRIVSVGYLLVDDEDRVVLVQSRQKDGDLAADTISIPRAVVVRISDLGPSE